MKLKMNKACDLNSISVFPPHTRRSSMIMAQQPRSQPSQQSFSQGVSSSQQNAMFSQLSQNSFDEMLTDNQRFGSQDKDNSVKRVSCLAPASYPREESQLPISMSSANLTRRWSSASQPDQKCQLSGELEHKLATMETLLTRLGMILDSVQADIMQVNKGTKELSLSVEGVRQKSIAQDDSLHNLTIICSLKTLDQKHLPLAILPPKVTGGDSSSQRPLFRRKPESRKFPKQCHFAPKVEQGWTIVKAEQGSLSNQYGNSCRNLLQRRVSPLARQQRIVVNLVEESDEDFSCFIIGNEIDNHRVDEEEVDRILKKARRKRKQSCKRLS
ncbi:hypothetical protein KSS87_001922 [Heliosperma pusillum]|nr:hypothetical protein KSS87_001922 [Heliosperma pusillum]